MPSMAGLASLFRQNQFLAFNLEVRGRGQGTSVFVILLLDLPCVGLLGHAGTTSSLYSVSCPKDLLAHADTGEWVP